MGTEHPEYEARFDAVAKPIRIPVRAVATMSLAMLATTAMLSIPTAIWQKWRGGLLKRHNAPSL